MLVIIGILVVLGGVCMLVMVNIFVGFSIVVVVVVMFCFSLLVWWMCLFI